MKLVIFDDDEKEILNFDWGSIEPVLVTQKGLSDSTFCEILDLLEIVAEEIEDIGENTEEEE